MRRHDKEEREKVTGNNNDLSYVPSERKEEIKSGTSGCVSFVVPYFQAATSTTDRLHTRWKKLVMFSKDMVVVFYNHSSLPHHTSFIQLT